MGISAEAQQVIQRPLDRKRVKHRPGRGGTTFDYIPADYAIELLNEAFGFEWDTRIINHIQVDSTVIVQLELSVPALPALPVVKQQFGSCDVNKGVTVGDAFKGAASDALKKCATLLGIALELYNDDSTAVGGFTAPSKPNRPAQSPAPSAPKSAEKPASPRPPAAPLPVPPAPRPMPASSVAPPSSIPKGTPSTAAVPAPAPPVVPTPPAPPARTPAPLSAAAGRPNPFEGPSGTAAGPNVTQLSALNNLAAKKEMNQPDMIARAAIVDEMGSPKKTFDELTHSEAIQVIKAAQQ